MRLVLSLSVAVATAFASDPAGASPPPGADLISVASRPGLRIFRDRDGLPENVPIALAPDPRGLLWIGTEDGLASYDGRVFTTFNAPKHEVSNFFRAVYADASGAVWCGLQDGGLARLEDGAWTTFEGTGLPSERVDAIAESVGSPSAGGTRALWVATPQGLARRDGSRWTVLGEANGLPSVHVGVLLDGHDEGGASALYAGTAAGLAVSRGGEFTPVPGAPVGPINALYESEAPARELWVAVYRQGVFRRAQGRWASFGKDDGLGANRVRAIAQTTAPDGTRTTWVASDDGLFQFDGHRFSPVLADALPSTTIWSLLPEPLHGPTRTLWVGVDGGLARLRPGGFRTLPGDAASKSTYAILVTQEAEKEVLWLGTRGAGLQRFDGASWTRLDPQMGVADTTIYAIAELDEGDGKRAVWVGTPGGDLARYAEGAWTTPMAGVSTVRQLHVFPADDGAQVLDVASGNPRRLAPGRRGMGAHRHERRAAHGRGLRRGRDARHGAGLPLRDVGRDRRRRDRAAPRGGAVDALRPQVFGAAQR